jgi:hypothetical protein
MPPLRRDSFRKQQKDIFLRRHFTQRAHRNIAKSAKNKPFLRCVATTPMCRICVDQVHEASSFGRPSVARCDGIHNLLRDASITEAAHRFSDMNDNDGHLSNACTTRI